MRLSCPGCRSSLLKFPFVPVALENNNHLFLAVSSSNQPEVTFIEPHLSSGGLSKVPGEYVGLLPLDFNCSEPL